MKRKQTKSYLKKFWYFIWEDDSIWSWIVNIVLAFVLIKFVVYPGLGFLLMTSHPVVAVVSESMEHTGGFDGWWESNKQWYETRGISKEAFDSYKFTNGFNKGDIMLLKGVEAENVNQGDVLVFISHRFNPRADPIIHRVIQVNEKDNTLSFETKGDNNNGQINSCDSLGCINEKDIREQQVIGKAVVRIPLLGYIKIGFVWLLQQVGVL